MKRIITKFMLYMFLTLTVMEALVRVFHLHNDRPQRFVDEHGILVWQPGQKGYSVQGNRRQNMAAYRINEAGYNSYREFEPSEDSYELALIGDSFIEGFHQDFNRSIGSKVESFLDHAVEVYEYGHSSNDFADAMQLMKAYEADFEQINSVIIYLDYEGDLMRSSYKFINRKTNVPFLRHSKLYIYLNMIGIINPIKGLMIDEISFLDKDRIKEGPYFKDPFEERLQNFKQLIARYGFDKQKIKLLIDAQGTDWRFMEYLEDNGFQYIDYSDAFSESEKPTTLIFDQHWNDHGRTLIARQIASRMEDVWLKER